jgi:hypothetical protein
MSQIPRRSSVQPQIPRRSSSADVFSASQQFAALSSSRQSISSGRASSIGRPSISNLKPGEAKLVDKKELIETITVVRRIIL